MRMWDACELYSPLAKLALGLKRHGIKQFGVDGVTELVKELRKANSLYFNILIAKFLKDTFGFSVNGEFVSDGTGMKELGLRCYLARTLNGEDFHAVLKI
jgi:hypothetical protein